MIEAFFAAAATINIYLLWVSSYSCRKRAEIDDKRIKARLDAHEQIITSIARGRQ